jgi:small subunit ribosomal protein S1
MRVRHYLIDKGNMALTPIDPNEQTPATANETPQTPSAQASENQTLQSGEQKQADAQAETTKRRILIGSQRDPAAYRARLRRNLKLVVEGEEDQSAPQTSDEPAADSAPTAKEKDAASAPAQETLPGEATVPVPTARQTKAEVNELNSTEPVEVSQAEAPLIVPPAVLNDMLEESPPLPELPDETMPIPGTGHITAPNIRQRLTPDLEAEYEKALGEASLDELLTAGAGQATEEQLDIHSQRTGRIVAVRKDDVFVELGGREQGVVPLHQFKDPPAVGGTVEVLIQRLNPDDGLYELMLPNTAVHVEDWSDLSEGALVEARITGQNNGGLECEVNHIRGFIPISQVSLYRVENLEEYVGQHFPCLVTEADTERRNLVLSRRAVLEREQEEARQKLLASLKPGQIHEGVVRKLMDFGAFVDIGGVEGLLHVSQLAWGRVKHPSDVLTEGQKIQVRIEKINPATGKISLAYRDLLESPWTAAAQKYPPNSIVRGTVTKIMEYGAFVELEPGVEGLIHISQLSHKRVWRAADMVKEGQEIEVLVLSVDPNAQRISLSIKALSQPEPTKKEKGQPEADQSNAKSPSSTHSKRKKPGKNLQGGLGKATGAGFGLKW